MPMRRWSFPIAPMSWKPAQSSWKAHRAPFRRIRASAKPILERDLLRCLATRDGEYDGIWLRSQNLSYKIGVGKSGELHVFARADRWRHEINRGRRIPRPFPRPNRCRGKDRTDGSNAVGLSTDAGQANVAACAFRDRRHVSRKQLDYPRPDAAAKTPNSGKSPGRGRSWTLYLFGDGNPRRFPRGTARPIAGGNRQVFQCLQLS